MKDIFDNALVEPFVSSPTIGLGLRAKQDLACGDVFLSIDRELMLTATRARELLKTLLPSHRREVGRPFDSVTDLVVGQIVGVLPDEQGVQAQFEGFDDGRRAILGCVRSVEKIKMRKGTVGIRGSDGELLWFLARDLTAPNVPEAVDLLLDEEALVLCLIQLSSSGDASFVHPALPAWIDKLPRTHNQPMFWDETERSELDGTINACQAADERAEAEALHTSLKHTFGDVAAGPFDEFLVALALVRSRVLSVCPVDFPSLTEKEELALLPYIDLANNDSTAPIVDGHIRESDDGTCIQARAVMAFNAGDEVFFNYGANLNSKFLFGWGFVPLVNPYNAVAFHFFADKATVRDPERVALCKLAVEPSLAAESDIRRKHCGIGAPCTGTLPVCYALRTPRKRDDAFEVHIMLTCADPLPSPLLSLCRLQVFSVVNLAKLRATIGESELVRRLQAGERLAKPGDPGMMRSWLEAEDLMISGLRGCIDNLLRSYPTTMEYDEGLLTSSSKGTRQLLAVALRISEKRILHAARLTLDIALSTSLPRANVSFGPTFRSSVLLGSLLVLLIAVMARTQYAITPVGIGGFK